MTGPASPAKMAINALNSGAKVWLADLEDASCPSWANVIDAIVNLRDAARGTLSFTQAGVDGKGGVPRSARTRRSPSSWSGRAAGTCRRPTCSSTAQVGVAGWSTSVCTSSTSPSS